jgi:hypothetical protein
LTAKVAALEKQKADLVAKHKAYVDRIKREMKKGMDDLKAHIGEQQLELVSKRMGCWCEAVTRPWYVSMWL